jgi:hypothetical protein
MPVEGGSNRGLTFAMIHGYAPWDPAVDPLRERAAAMVKAREEREQMLALEEAKGEKQPVVIDTKATEEDDAALETLESVTPPEDPGAFNPGGSRR